MDRGKVYLPASVFFIFNYNINATHLRQRNIVAGDFAGDGIDLPMAGFPTLFNPIRLLADTLVI